MNKFLDNRILYLFLTFNKEKTEIGVVISIVHQILLVFPLFRISSFQRVILQVPISLKLGVAIWLALAKKWQQKWHASFLSGTSWARVQTPWSLSLFRVTIESQSRDRASPGLGTWVRMMQGRTCRPNCYSCLAEGSNDPLQF